MGRLFDIKQAFIVYYRVWLHMGITKRSIEKFNFEQILELFFYSTYTRVYTVVKVTKFRLEDKSNVLQTFFAPIHFSNVISAQHLSNQCYDICIRREIGICYICFVPTISIATAPNQVN